MKEAKPWMEPALRLAGGAVILAIALFVIFYVAPLLYIGGVFGTVKPISPGTCTALTGITGGEDIQIDHAAGLMFVSATDRHAGSESPNPQDGLYVMDLANKALGFRNLAGTPAEFHPHGLSLYVGADGARTLMVINHKRLGTSPEALAGSVEIFGVTRESGLVTLQHRRTVSDPLLSSPNDLVAVGHDRFYAVNQFGSRNAFGIVLEVYLRLAQANAVFYDGEHLSVAYDGLKYPAGIAASSDYQMIYIPEATARKVWTYVGDPFTGELRRKTELAIPTVLDNLDTDADGFVWAAGHPKALALAGYAGNAKKPSPSEIWKVQILRGTPVSARRIYVNRGEEIGGASVGAVHQGHLYIGSPFDTKVLDCTLSR